jgi:GntR family transcriptional regulator
LAAAASPGTGIPFHASAAAVSPTAKTFGHDLEAEPVFALLENKYNTPLVEAEYKLEAAAADLVAAQALQVPAGSPIFLIERTSYTIGYRSVDYERLHYRGDLIRFVTRLARRARASMQR